MGTVGCWQFLDKDEEELNQYVKSIMTVVWEQLTSTDVPLSPVLGKAGIKFMTILAKSFHSELFASPEVLSAVVQRVILPQVSQTSFKESMVFVSLIL